MTYIAGARTSTHSGAITIVHYPTPSDIKPLMRKKVRIQTPFGILSGTLKRWHPYARTHFIVSAATSDLSSCYAIFQMDQIHSLYLPDVPENDIPTISIHEVKRP